MLPPSRHLVFVVGRRIAIERFNLSGASRARANRGVLWNEIVPPPLPKKKKKQTKKKGAGQLSARLAQADVPKSESAIGHILNYGLARHFSLSARGA